MRPVSLREFQSRHQFTQTSDETRLQQMAKQLQEQLKQRSGMFQFTDLSEPPDVPPPAVPLEEGREGQQYG